MNIYELLQKIIAVKSHRIDCKAYLEEEKNRLDSEEDKKIFELLKNISSLRIKLTREGFIFHPMLVWDGRRTFSIEDISEQDYNILKSLELDKIPLNLKAHITNLLWVERREYEAAIVAAETYLKLYKLWHSDKSWTKPLEMIRRAIYISTQINYTEVREKACNTIYDEVMELKDDGFFSLGLLNILIEQDYEKYDELLAVAEKKIEKYKKNIYKVKQAYEIKKLCLKKLKKNELIQKSNIELADYYITYAEGILEEDMQGAMEAQSFFQKAIEIYRNNAGPSKAEQALRRLVEIQKEIPKQMNVITMEFDVSGVHANIDANMKNLTFEESIIRLTQLVPFPQKETVKKNLIKEYGENPSSLLFGAKIVNASGQTKVTLKPLSKDDPEKDSELLDMHLHQKMLEKEKLYGDIWLKYVFDYIRNNNDFNPSDLDFLVFNNAIIPEGRERIFRSAIYMALKGQYYEAMHVLAPQIENLFRHIAKEAGGLTTTLGNDGTFQEKVLSSIFDLPELLDCYNNDILFLFKGLLNEKAGANIRNEIAHGIVDEATTNAGAYLYFVGAVIKMLSFTSKKCYKILRRSTNLNSFIEPGEDVIKGKLAQ